MEAGTRGALFAGTLAAIALSLSWAAPAAAADDDASAEPDRASERALDLGGVTLALRRVPKGTFTQGSQATEIGRESDETQRPVTITRELWMGKFPVTRGQFARFATDTRYVTEAEKGQSGGFGWDGKQLVQKKEFTWRNPGFAQTDDDPVVLVTFGDANAFVAWASRKTGERVRLPTEAEWEYAARAGTTTPWYAGKSEDDALASGWLKPNAGGGTHPVGRKAPNAFGLFDTSGNVYEWCRDVYAPYPPGPAADPESTRAAAGEPERRVLRGGSWLKDPKRARSAARYRNTPGSRNADNGFRVVVAPDDTLVPGGFGGGADPLSNPAPPVGLSGTPVSPGGAAPPSTAAAARAGRSGESSSGWLLVAAPAAAAGAVVAWLLARRRKGTHTSPSGVTTRPGTDGFFVRAPNVPAGSRVRWSALVDGVEVSDVVPLDGGDETFVYTGGTPSAIRIVELVLASGTQGYRGPAPAERPSRDTSRRAAVVAAETQRDDSPFLGSPRAY
jgi:formylglycine-generating enzyme required for sulfatase activity